MGNIAINFDLLFSDLLEKFLHFPARKNFQTVKIEGKDREVTSIYIYLF